MRHWQHLEAAGYHTQFLCMIGPGSATAASLFANDDGAANIPSCRNSAELPKGRPVPAEMLLFAASYEINVLILL